MNREEALQEVVKWREWHEDGSIPVKCAPKEWLWRHNGERVILVHSIYDPITRADWERARSPANPTPPTVPVRAMNREEALEYVSKYVWWPKPDAPTKSLPYAPTGWEWIDDKVGATGKALFNPSYGMITVNDWQDARNGVVASTPAPNKYQRTVPSTTIDVYDVLHAYNVTNPATQHAVKKLLQPGKRGHKDTLTDLREALASIQRAIQIEEQSQ